MTNRKIDRDKFPEHFDQKYQDDFPARLIKMMSRAYTVAMCAAEFGVTERTLHRWKQPRLANGAKNKHYKPEFALAYAEAEVKSKAYLHQIALEQLERPNKNFDTALYIVNLKQRFGIYEPNRHEELPELSKCKNYAEQSTQLLEAFERGALSAEDASKLSKVIVDLANVTSVHEAVQLLNNVSKDLKENGDKEKRQ